MKFLSDINIQYNEWLLWLITDINRYDLILYSENLKKSMNAEFEKAQPLYSKTRDTLTDTERFAHIQTHREQHKM